MQNRRGKARKSTARMHTAVATPWPTRKSRTHALAVGAADAADARGPPGASRHATPTRHAAATHPATSHPTVSTKATGATTTQTSAPKDRHPRAASRSRCAFAASLTSIASTAACASSHDAK